MMLKVILEILRKLSFLPFRWLFRVMFDHYTKFKLKPDWKVEIFRSFKVLKDFELE